MSVLARVYYHLDGKSILAILAITSATCLAIYAARDASVRRVPKFRLSAHLYILFVEHFE